MALLYRPGYDPTRVYEGADTRAFALLIGSALAFVWPRGHLQQESKSRWVLDAADRRARRFRRVVWHKSEYSGVPVSRWAGSALARNGADGGFYRLTRRRVRPDAGAATATPGCRASAPTACTFRHFPIILLTTPADGRDTLVRGALQVAASIGCAALSLRRCLEPIRHGALRRWWAQIRCTGWRLGAMDTEHGLWFQHPFR